MSNSFLQCVADICGLELATLAKEYKYSVFGGKTAVIEGHGGILEYGRNAVSFSVHRSVLRVCGENLSIKCLEKNFAVISGIISNVEVVDEK